MPDKDIDSLLAGAVVSEEVRKLLLRGNLFEAIATLGRIYPDIQIDLSGKEEDLLKSIKTETLPEFTQKMLKARERE